MLVLAAAVILLALSLVAANALKGTTPEEAKSVGIEARQLTIQFKKELRAASVAFCEAKIKPIVQSLVGILREEIAQSKSPLIHKLVGNRIPPGELGRQIALSNAARRTRIREIAPADCHSIAR